MDFMFTEEELKMMNLREEALTVYLKLRKIEIGDDEDQYRDQAFFDLITRISKADQRNLEEFIYMCQQMCQESLDLTDFDDNNDFFYQEEFDTDVIQIEIN